MQTGQLSCVAGKLARCCFLGRLLSLAAPGWRGGLWLRLMARGSFAHRSMCEAVLSHSRERTKGRPVAANPSQHHGCPRTPRRLGCGRNLPLREANRFLAGAAWNAFWVLCMLSAGGRAAPVGRPRCAQVSGLLVAPDGAAVPLPAARAWGAVLSHSRERTKGRPGAANLRQHHGCPRAPPRLAWERNLLLREANCFLAGAAWSSFAVMLVVRWRPGGTVAALVAGGLVDFWLRLCLWPSMQTDSTDKVPFCAHGAWPEEHEYSPSASVGGRRLPRP